MPTVEFQRKLERLRRRYLTGVVCKIVAMHRAAHELTAGRPAGDRLLLIYHLAHRLGGSGATFGIRPISREAQALEQWLEPLLADGVAPDRDSVGWIDRAIARLAWATADAFRTLGEGEGDGNDAAVPAAGEDSRDTKALAAVVCGEQTDEYSETWLRILAEVAAIDRKAAGADAMPETRRESDCRLAGVSAERMARIETRPIARFGRVPFRGVARCTRGSTRPGDAGSGRNGKRAPAARSASDEGMGTATDTNAEWAMPGTGYRGPRQT